MMDSISRQNCLNCHEYYKRCLKWDSHVTNSEYFVRNIVLDKIVRTRCDAMRCDECIFLVESPKWNTCFK